MHAAAGQPAYCRCRAKQRIVGGLCFHAAAQVLELRLQQWLAAGRSCLIVGDLNISPAAIDSCHPPAEFDHQRCDRLWLKKMLGPQGPGVVDAFRMFHPSR
jgi:exonuclease III